MPSDENYGPLCDIQRNIELTQSFVAGHTYETFRADQRTAYAVVRCLEIISEASRRLSSDLKARHPEVPWSDMAAAGNIYRHDYEDVQDRSVWKTVQHSLEPLLNIVRMELERIGPQ